MKTIKVLVMGLFFFSSCYTQDSIAQMLALSTEYLYPYSQFNGVQAMCKSVWSDLDLFLTHEPLEQLEEKIPLLCKNIDRLVQAVKRMVVNPSESASYLPEDMLYLMQLITLLAHKYTLVSHRLKQELGADLIDYHKYFDQMSFDLEYVKSLRDEIVLVDRG